MRDGHRRRVGCNWTGSFPWFSAPERTRRPSAPQSPDNQSWITAGSSDHPSNHRGGADGSGWWRCAKSEYYNRRRASDVAREIRRAGNLVLRVDGYEKGSTKKKAKGKDRKDGNEILARASAARYTSPKASQYSACVGASTHRLFGDRRAHSKRSRSPAPRRAMRLMALCAGGVQRRLFNRFCDVWSRDSRASHELKSEAEAKRSEHACRSVSSCGASAPCDSRVCADRARPVVQSPDTRRLDPPDRAARYTCPPREWEEENAHEWRPDPQGTQIASVMSQNAAENRVARGKPGRGVQRPGRAHDMMWCTEWNAKLEVSITGSIELRRDGKPQSRGGQRSKLSPSGPFGGQLDVPVLHVLTAAELRELCIFCGGRQAGGGKRAWLNRLHRQDRPLESMEFGGDGTGRSSKVGGVDVHVKWDQIRVDENILPSEDFIKVERRDIFTSQFLVPLTAVSEKLDYLVWESDQSCAALAVGNALAAVLSLPQSLSSKYFVCPKTGRNTYRRCLVYEAWARKRLDCIVDYKFAFLASAWRCSATLGQPEAVILSPPSKVLSAAEDLWALLDGEVVSPSESQQSEQAAEPEKKVAADFCWVVRMAAVMQVKSSDETDKEVVNPAEQKRNECGSARRSLYLKPALIGGQWEPVDCGSTSRELSRVRFLVLCQRLNGEPCQPNREFSRGVEIESQKQGSGGIFTNTAASGTRREPSQAMINRSEPALLRIRKRRRDKFLGQEDRKSLAKPTKHIINGTDTPQRPYRETPEWILKVEIAG
ncbi:hypothetical protein K438DRAFT_1937572 [Mycena galopus ATCC 62051]|nr:hypothetical protein K438DRAFT_1937572 [Mycena galopus ATCC 62051]